MLCSITHTHSLFSVPFEALTVNTRDSARASFARVPLAYLFAILSLVSGPLLDRCGHLVAAIASSHTRAPRARSTGSPASLPQHRPLHEPFSRQGTALPAAGTTRCPSRRPPGQASRTRSRDASAACRSTGSPASLPQHRPLHEPRSPRSAHPCSSQHSLAPPPRALLARRRARSSQSRSIVAAHAAPPGPHPSHRRARSSAHAPRAATRSDAHSLCARDNTPTASTAAPPV